jgi:hypothetical protein
MAAWTRDSSSSVTWAVLGVPTVVRLPFGMVVPFLTMIPIYSMLEESLP